MLCLQDLQEKGTRQLQGPVAAVLTLLTDVTKLCASCVTPELRGPARAVKIQASQADATSASTARVPCSACHYNAPGQGRFTADGTKWMVLNGPCGVLAPSTSLWHSTALSLQAQPCTHAASCRVGAAATAAARSCLLPQPSICFPLCPAEPGVQMVLEECLARAHRLGLVELACLIKPLDAGLVPPSKAPAL